MGLLCPGDKAALEVFAANTVCRSTPGPPPDLTHKGVLAPHTLPLAMNSPLSKAGSPLSRTRRQTGASGTVADARQSRVEPGMVERLFSEGKALCDAGRYDEAEDKWKQVLQVATECLSQRHRPSSRRRAAPRCVPALPACSLFVADDPSACAIPGVGSSSKTTRGRCCTMQSCCATRFMTARRTRSAQSNCSSRPWASPISSCRLA